MDYYNKHYLEFIENTFNCNMNIQYEFFFNYLNKSANVILDLGFGSGRDSLYFLNKGYDVYSLDPSKELCENGIKLGLPHIYMKTAQQMDFINKFDGIWACASLLHIKSNELNDVFKKCANSLKENGIMYCSFKYGDFEGIRNDRYYVDLNEKSIKKYLLNTNLNIIDFLITDDVRNNNETKWLNVILKKIA